MRRSGIDESMDSLPCIRSASFFPGMECDSGSWGGRGLLLFSSNMERVILLR